MGVLFVCPIESEEKQRIGLTAENGPCLELLVWIRRAHRGVGLGERVLQTEEFQALVKWLEAQKASLVGAVPGDAGGGRRGSEPAELAELFLAV